VVLQRSNIVRHKKKTACNLCAEAAIATYFLDKSSRKCLLIALIHSLYRFIVPINVCEESDLLKVKVPLVRPSTEGVPALREGRYIT
jgi:hypothetical protein